MKQKQMLLELLRWAAVVLAVVLLLISFRQAPSSNALPEEVLAAITDTLDLSNLQQGDNQMVKRLYGLDPAVYEACLLYYPVTNMEAEELLLVKLSDPAQADTVRAALEARLETQKTSFDGYGLEQYDLLTRYCVIEVRGNYVLFVVHRDCDAARSAFLNAL